MRLTAVVALMIWLLAGWSIAPALAFGPDCHAGASSAAMPADMAMPHMARAMPAGMHMHHDTAPGSQGTTGKDAGHKAMACAVHCLGMGSGLALAAHVAARYLSPAMTVSLPPDSRLLGRIPGPPLEPPIAASA